LLKPNDLQHEVDNPKMSFSPTWIPTIWWNSLYWFKHIDIMRYKSQKIKGNYIGGMDFIKKPRRVYWLMLIV
jgi:hypothetical protein